MRNCMFALTLLLGSSAGAIEGETSVFHSFLNEYLTEIGSEPVGEDCYELAFFDLNNDGIEDALALMGRGTEWVGSGGAALFIFQGLPDGYGFVSMTTLAGSPVLVRKRSTEGWRAILVQNSGGGYPATFRELAFSQGGYPLNPTLQRETEPMGSDMVVIP